MMLLGKAREKGVAQGSGRGGSLPAAVTGFAILFPLLAEESKGT